MVPEVVERKFVLVSGKHRYPYKTLQEAMGQLLEVGQPNISRLFRLMAFYPCAQTRGGGGRRRQHPLQVSFSEFRSREISGRGRDE